MTRIITHGQLPRLSRRQGARRRTIVLLTLFCIVGGSAMRAAEPLTIETLREARRELTLQPRRIIFNNDGCDCLYFPQDLEPTVENFLLQRTTSLADSQVDTFAYCSISSGFSNFTHNTAVGTVLEHSARDFGIQPEMRNIARDLISQDTDCLQAVVRFAHQHDREVFWSMRMNDTHDVAHRPDKPYFLFPPLKVQYPDWLVGEPVRRTPVGRWSSVDYARPEIRELAFQYLQEVVRHYDVDGVELDFFRHLCYFRSVAEGGVATAEERAMMTELLRRVRTMTEQEGLKRGRPVLLSVRVPDSVEYCRGQGLDIESWLRDGLVDLLVTTCYFRLNPWQYSVELGRRYGVPVYPCLSDSRVRGETRFRRSSVESYRGRAMNAWAAGAAGIHLFNLFNPNSPVFREVGDPESLRMLDKLYFVTVRDGNPDQFLAGGRQYRQAAMLTPTAAVSISPDQPLVVQLAVGDDFAKLPEDRLPAVTCHLEVPGLLSADQAAVEFNGQRLAGGKLHDGWLDLSVPLAAVRTGENTVQVAIAEKTPAAGESWTIVYDGDGEPPRPWRRDPGSARTEQEISDGVVRIADRGTESGDYCYWRIPWGADPQEQVTVEARATVVSGSSYVILSAGQRHERLGLWPDHIDLWSNRQLRYEMDTTDDFHDYRIVFQGDDLQVYVDGQLRIDARDRFRPTGNTPSSELAFGAANSPQVGEAVWDRVRATARSLVCSDVVLRVDFGE